MDDISHTFLAFWAKQEGTLILFFPCGKTPMTSTFTRCKAPRVEDWAAGLESNQYFESIKTKTKNI